MQLFTAPSFSNLCMMISPSIFAAPGYCMSLSHIPATHPSVINYVQKNSLNTVKFNFPKPKSDVVWCEKLNANVVKQHSSEFFIIRKSYPGPSLIQFYLKGNNKSKSESKRVVQCFS